MIARATLDLADGRAVDVVTFGKMRLRELTVLTFCCSLQVVFTGAAGQHKVHVRWHASRLRNFMLEAGAAQLESAVELALGKLTIAMRQAGTVARA